MYQNNVGVRFERIAFDIAGLFPESDREGRCLLIGMDYFTKWLEVYVTHNQEATTLAGNM
jgi:hypothetical protein